MPMWLNQVYDALRVSREHQRCLDVNEVEWYIAQAYEALTSATDNIQLKHYSTAINRAYYSMFYAANALLATKGIQRAKHSGVLAAFRQEFVKPGLIEAHYSDSYGDAMDSRHQADYAVGLNITKKLAQAYLRDAQRFVARAEQYLEENKLG
jgi:uncharacterized protein (UPF0332 family)